MARANFFKISETKWNATQGERMQNSQTAESAYFRGITNNYKLSRCNREAPSSQCFDNYSPLRTFQCVAHFSLFSLFSFKLRKG